MYSPDEMMAGEKIRLRRFQMPIHLHESHPWHWGASREKVDEAEHVLRSEPVVEAEEIGQWVTGQEWVYLWQEEGEWKGEEMKLKQEKALGGSESA
jgi:hypothetical protein